MNINYGHVENKTKQLGIKFGDFANLSLPPNRHVVLHSKPSLQKTTLLPAASHLSESESPPPNSSSSQRIRRVISFT